MLLCVCQLSHSLSRLSGDEALWLDVVSNIKQKFALHEQSAYRQLYVACTDDLVYSSACSSLTNSTATHNSNSAL